MVVILPLGNVFTEMNDEDILTASAGQSNAQNMRRGLAIFARAPVRGLVKTRLIGARFGSRVLNAGDAVQFYEAMLRDTIEMARRATRAMSIEVVLSHSPDDAFSLKNGSLAQIWSGARLAQGEGDLGARLLHCFANLRARGFEQIVVIGSDAPDMPLERLHAAFDELENNDLVFGPAFDGGFYLMGANKNLPAGFFDGIAWSTPLVLRQVRQSAAREKLCVALLDPWRDIDDGEDLCALIERLKNGTSGAPHTQQVISSLGLLQPRL